MVYYKKRNNALVLACPVEGAALEPGLQTGLFLQKRHLVFIGPIYGHHGC